MLKKHKVLPPLAGKTIVLDPGHGGNDWGARYVDPADRIDIREKDQVLDVARRLRALLDECCVVGEA